MNTTSIKDTLNQRLSSARILLEDSAGRTVKKAVDTSDRVVITFTDGTYASLQLRTAFDDTTELVDAALSVPFETWEVLEAGLITDEEKAALDKEADDARLAEKEAHERRMYEALKRKFEGEA